MKDRRALTNGSMVLMGHVFTLFLHICTAGHVWPVHYLQYMYYIYIYTHTCYSMHVNDNIPNIHHEMASVQMMQRKNQGTPQPLLFFQNGTFKFCSSFNIFYFHAQTKALKFFQSRHLRFEALTEPQSLSR